MILRPFGAALAALSALCLLAACGTRIDEKSSTLTAMAAQCAAGQAAFTKTVFPLIREHCALCHDGSGNGPAIGPAFAVKDPEESYSRVRARIDFTNIQHSLFISTGGNKHCLSRGGPADCGMTHDQVLTAAQNWWTQGENSCSALSRYVTAPLPLPASLPTAATSFATLRWDLSALDPSLKGVSFEIQAQHFAPPSASTKGAYRFREPRLKAAGSPLAIKGVKLALNGSFDLRANEYASVQTTVMPLPGADGVVSSYPSLSPFTAIVLQDKPSGDTLQIGFDDIALTTASQCKATDKFRAILDVMAARDCYACHGGGPDHESGTDPARQRFAMTGSLSDLCNAALQRSDRITSQASVFVSYPLRGSNGHPRVYTGPREIMPAFEAWLAAESTP